MDGGGTGTFEGFWRVLEHSCPDGGAGKTTRTNFKHHEHTASTQVKFATEVGALGQVLEDMGNPFMEESEGHLVLDSRDVADPAIVQTVRDIENTGQDQYDKYMTERVIERTTPVFDPISKNQMPLFSLPPSIGPSKTKHTTTLHCSGNCDHNDSSCAIIHICILHIVTNLFKILMLVIYNLT